MYEHTRVTVQNKENPCCNVTLCSHFVIFIEAGAGQLLIHICFLIYSKSIGRKHKSVKPRTVQQHVGDYRDNLRGKYVYARMYRYDQ